MKTLVLNESLLEDANKLEKEISGNIYSSMNDNRLSIVLVDNERVIGVISFQYVVDEADILYLCIDKNYRGQGLSKVLFNDSINYLKQLNIKNIFLEVNEHNNVAYNLYKSIGFIEISRREKYYNGIDTGIVMKIEIC